MKAQIKWLSDALADKDIIVEMTHFCVRNGEIVATDGKLTAGTPFDSPDEFLVPGAELKKLLHRMPNDPSVELLEGAVRLRCGRFNGKISTLPAESYEFPTVPEAQWRPIPEGLLGALQELRPFVSDNASRPWAICVAVEPDWLYATTNVAIAGIPFDTGADVRVLLPVYTVDFILGRTENLVEWAVTEGYISFRWSDGSWLRSALVAGSFPENAAGLVRKANEETELTPVTAEFKAAFDRVAELSREALWIYPQHVATRFDNAEAEEAWEGTAMPLPAEAERTCWTSEFLRPVIENAEAWGPDRWPSPAPFRGGKLVGYVLGRNE